MYVSVCVCIYVNVSFLSYQSIDYLENGILVSIICLNE